MPTPSRRIDRNAMSALLRGHEQAIAHLKLNRTRRFIIAHPAFPTTDVPPPAR